MLDREIFKSVIFINSTKLTALQNNTSENYQNFYSFILLVFKCHPLISIFPNILEAIEAANTYRIRHSLNIYVRLAFCLKVSNY
jgi:hypothetical protein